MNEHVETVIVGGGHAGLTLSHFLTQAGQEHLVLERGLVGERWRSERWDSFRFNFPNWALQLPGYKYRGKDLDHFASKDQVVKFLEDYAVHSKAPVRHGIEVTSLRQDAEDGRYLIDAGGSTIEASNIVIATGPFQHPFVPETNVCVPDDVVQVHSASYRNPDQLPPGAVLVVGAGSSGCQIADELSECGRQVYLSVGQHRRVPRRYRGRDYVWWRWKMGAWDRKLDSLSSPRERYAPVPLLTGVHGGYDVDLRQMASKGMILLGRLDQLADGRLTAAPDLRDNVAKGDQWFRDFKRSVDDYVVKTGTCCEPESRADADLRDPKEITAPILQVNLKAAGINSIVWSSGFRYQFDWVKLPVIDEAGEPVHTRGRTRAPGCFFLGLQWLYKLKSAFLSLGGPEEDAIYLAEQIAARRNP